MLKNIAYISGFLLNLVLLAVLKDQGFILLSLDFDIAVFHEFLLINLASIMHYRTHARCMQKLL